MFEPNLNGTLYKPVSRDVHGRVTWGPAITCPFGAVSLKKTMEETTRRADSSGSRGAARQQVTHLASILVPSWINPSIGDRFEFETYQYQISAIHPRYSVIRGLDHWECDVEVKVG